MADRCSISFIQDTQALIEEFFDEVLFPPGPWNNLPLDSGMLISCDSTRNTVFGGYLGMLYYSGSVIVNLEPGASRSYGTIDIDVVGAESSQQFSLTLAGTSIGILYDTIGVQTFPAPFFFGEPILVMTPLSGASIIQIDTLTWRDFG